MQKFKRIAGIFCYVLGGFLLVFYLVTLWRGLHPSPSVEYRLYYLDQQLAFWPGENGLAIEPDSVLSFGPDCGSGQGANHLARGEWICAGETGWQSRNMDSMLYFTARAGSQYNGALTLCGTAGQTVTLYADGEEAGHVLLSGGEDTLDFACTVPDSGLLTLSLAADSPITILEMMFS